MAALLLIDGCDCTNNDIVEGLVCDILDGGSHDQDCSIRPPHNLALYAPETYGYFIGAGGTPGVAIYHESACTCRQRNHLMTTAILTSTARCVSS